MTKGRKTSYDECVEIGKNCMTPIEYRNYLNNAI